MPIPLTKLKIDTNTKYKLEKKKQAELEKRKQKRLDLIEKNKKKAIEEVERRYTRKAEIKIKKIEKSVKDNYRKTIEKLVWKTPKPKKQSIKKIKQKAKDEFCKFCKISRADGYGYVITMDTKQRKHRTETVGWHLRPFQNYPQLAFEVDNCRPITQGTNRRQADSFWEERSQNVENELTIEKFMFMKKLARDKQLKNIKRDSKYYNDLYEYYKRENTRILANLKTK